MRRTIACLILLLMLLIVAPALADTYVLDDIYGSVDIPVSYIVLTPDNLNDYADWLEAQGKTMEEVSNDFIRRGVLLQAWTAELDVCFELRANRTEQSMAIFDVNEQSTSVRGTYRTAHYPDNLYDGYDFSESNWKNTENGRFLVLRYTRRDGGDTLYRGLMRRTIRNGYEIDFDMQIHGRAVTNKDNSNLNKIWNTFRFIELLEMPPAASAKINITDPPPAETKQQSFNIVGTAAEGVKLTAVVMRMSDPEPTVTDVTVGKNGKFKLPIKLPREGVFAVTLTCEYQGEDVAENVYIVTYQNTMLAINLINRPGEIVTTDETKISGTAEPGASIQVFLNGDVYDTKRVTAAGKFAVTVDTKEEGSYEVVLIFSKEKLADRRLVFNFNRRWTEDDMLEYLKKQAIKPAYNQLISKMEGYEGRIMGYKPYIVDISNSGNEYIVRMALSRSNGEYKNIILVTTSEQPKYQVGERVMMYGTCAGMSLSTGAEGETAAEESYPCFELLLFTEIE